ncbi:DUF1080 domain-containing protein [Catenovulum sp. 2E275]|uniref:3-keto-disaccharide hydrolase n=1 Tax=Catenovulum sp. 2E275 TaxID=2980497 RepID=UPI0021CE9419|nr:DUF1080 domain-containing protein [Catenovulum sp. 2E275]MCU4677103.1 DUF1080 domain-containing protein [Catenovulum sp. 2E275]
MKKQTTLLAITLVGLFSLSAHAKTEEMKPEHTELWKTVKKVNPDPVPSDAIVLFDGTNMDQWTHEDGSKVEWKIEDGVVTIVNGTQSIITKEKFCDVQLHIEFRAPKPEGKPLGQSQGNSGLYFQKRYEVQILDSYDNPTYANGQAAAVYKQNPPLVNASRAPMNWQTYDIIYHAPIFNEQGVLKKRADVTVLHNGVLAQDHYVLQGDTRYIGFPQYNAHTCDHLLLQNHGQIVSFRNIWIRKL